MIRHSRGVTLVAARSWVFIFAFAFIASFFTTHNSSALSLDPVLDDVFSLIQRNQGDAPQKSDPGVSNKDKNDNVPDRASFNGSAQTDTQTPSDGLAAPETPIVTEPLTELPVLDSSDMLAQPIRSTQPQRVAPAAGIVLGVSNTASVMSVQATSQGWKFFGIAWFWWLAIGVAAYYAVRQLAVLYRRKLLYQKPMVG